MDDQNSGLLTVKGSFARTAEFDVSGYPSSRASYNTTYEADQLSIGGRDRPRWPGA